MTNKNLQIKFGTDGWRDIIAERFTFNNVAKVLNSVASYLKKGTGKPSVVIGYDTRFLSKEFALFSANFMSKKGIAVILSDTNVSTPCVSANVVSNNADGGIIFSASHNPPEFNGFKFKTNQGASAPKDVTSFFEDNIKPGILVPDEIEPSKISKKNLTKDYFKALKKVINIKVLKKKRLKIVVDPMYGSGLGYMKSLLKDTKCTIIEIHSKKDPLFGGLHPEPIEMYLSDLKKTVKQSGADIGLATDGDADRIGVVDEDGNYLTPQEAFPLLLYYLCKYKGIKGKVVQSVSLGFLSERIAKDYSLEWEEVPVGFKYIADRILSGGLLIGGEESGGYGYGNFLPERDGILNSLMFIEMIAVTGKSISCLLKEIEKKYGKSCYLRKDIKRNEKVNLSKEEFSEKIKASFPKVLLGKEVNEIKTMDGAKVSFNDSSWLLFRPSGTEPIIRVYTETQSLKVSREMIAFGGKLVKKLYK